jgi:ABC-type dipeptide/oligopeptide/nickel transport system ATPase component
MADSVAIMKRGRIVESGNTEKVMCNPADDYTKRLIGDIFNL